MDPEAVKKTLAKPAGDAVAALPARFFDALVISGLRVDVAESGRVLCSFTVPPRLCSSGNVLLSGVVATLVDVIGSAVLLSSGLPATGVSLDINISQLDAAFIGEEIEIESKLLHSGKAIGVASVEFRNKRTGKLIALGRHTKYLPASSKL